MKFTIAIFVAVVACASVVQTGHTDHGMHGQHHNETMQMTFNSLDLNLDGHLTESEIYVYYDHMDKNGDGTITFAEFSNGAQNAENDPEVKGAFDYYDKMPGVADNEMHRDDARVMFSMLDENGNGKVTFHEFLLEFTKILVAIQEQVALETPAASR